MTIERRLRPTRYRELFDTELGHEVLEDMQSAILREFMISQRTVNDIPNPAYMNPYCALAQQAQLEVIERIYGLIAKSQETND